MLSTSQSIVEETRLKELESGFATRAFDHSQRLPGWKVERELAEMKEGDADEAQRVPAKTSFFPRVLIPYFPFSR